VPPDDPVAELARGAGLELSAYRAEHVAERIRRALERERVADAFSLAALVASDEAARSRFRRSVAVSVSGLFRDPVQFDLLERELLPSLLAEERRLTVWSAGCADGSELYSVAQLLESAGALDRSLLLGSDLLDENIERARRGVFGAVSFSSSLRARLHFEQRDLLRDGPPVGSWRLILCRNLAIYLAPAAKQALHELLAGALAPRGVLLLGKSERLSDPGRIGLRRVAPHAYVKEVAA
jgi:chemotaxis protein methyltransferase CheR